MHAIFQDGSTELVFRPCMLWGAAVLVHKNGNRAHKPAYNMLGNPTDLFVHNPTTGTSGPSWSTLSRCWATSRCTCC
jgi:hypothetical protein